MSTIETLTDVTLKTQTGTFLGVDSRHSDADSIRREFGLPEWDASKFDYQKVVPGALEHAKDHSAYSPPGGTDFLAVGKPGSGKSTLGLYWSARLLETNNETVVWRGSESRSEWVPFAPWARVCLPSSCDVTARLKSDDPDKPNSREVDLDDIAREVVYYDDPGHLNEELLERGKFHVVYPDPQMKGCQKLYEESSKRYELEFSPNDPVKHWWVAWVLARVEHGPYNFTSLLLDEVGDIISQDASKDEFSTYEKVLLFRDCFVDARKFNLSVYMFGHSEADIHEKLRRKVRWRITMNQIANPTRPGQVVGVNSVPMDTDMTSHMPVGRALMWTETFFDPSIAWKDIPKPTGEVLEVSLSPKRPASPGKTGEVAESEGGVSP
jgi:hypothetical protein